MEQWDIIRNNPQFQSAFGNQVTGDPNQWWSNLDQNTKDGMISLYGNPSATSAPVLDQQTNNQASPVLAGGFDAYGVPIGANMEASDPNQGFERVMVGGPNGGISAASVMYNPKTGAVKAVEGDPTSQMISQGANIQSMAQDAYNKSIAAPVQTAQKDLNTMERIVGAAEGDVSGPVLNQYTNAKNNLSSAQQAALSQVSNPSDVDMALGRPSYTTPNMTGLDAFTEERNANNINNPMSKPVLSTPTNFTVNNPNQEAARNTNNMNAPAANVPNVDYADPTMAPTNAMTMAMNEEAGRGNIYDGPVLVDTTQPNVTKTDGVLGGTTTTGGGPSVRSIMSSSGPKTSNRRQSDMPNMLVDRNEALIRIGGAMYSGGLQGDGIGAATREYGAIQDANRKTAMEKYKQDQAQKLAMAKAAAKGKDKDDKNIASMNAQMDNYQRALNAIAESRASGGNLTGIGGILKGFVDNFTGDEDAARRLLLSKVKVNEALLSVAHTKGAISNAEMKLFLSPAPKTYQDEKIWESWILERMDALQKVQNRLATGQQVPEDMRGPTVAGTRASINAAEADADGFSITIKETTQK